jgi:hypothetical protein
MFEHVKVPPGYRLEQDGKLILEDLTIGTIKTQMKGVERVEAEIQYWDRPEIKGPLPAGFGTMANPVQVPSWYNLRMVGCMGIL